MSNNKELLYWAVENVEEWPEEWTLLRSDSNTECFWTKTDGHWRVHDIEWTTESSGYKDYKPFSTSTPQVISKQEWEEAVKESKQEVVEVSSSDSLYETVPLEKGTYLVKREDFEQFQKDADAGGLRSELSEELFSETYPSWSTSKGDELLYHYGTGVHVLGFDYARHKSEGSIPYKPTPKTTFTKSDLVPGKHVVVTTDGKVHTIIGNFLLEWEGGCWFHLDNYDESLLYLDGDEFYHVHKVYEVPPSNYKPSVEPKELLKLVWERNADERRQLEQEIKQKEEELQALKETLDNI